MRTVRQPTLPEKLPDPLWGASALVRALMKALDERDQREHEALRKQLEQLPTKP